MADEKRPPESPGPADLSSRLVRDEARKAAVWLGMALAIVGVIVLAQPILLILGGMIAEQGRTVVVWDAADARGTLTERAEGAPTLCVSEVEAAPAVAAGPWCYPSGA